MLRFLINFILVIISVPALSAGTIHYKTTINKTLLPPLFPADKAVAVSDLYYNDMQCLLAFNKQETTSKRFNPETVDFVTLREKNNKGNAAKWINGKWVATSIEYQYEFKSIIQGKTKIICGYSCYAVLFSDQNNSLINTGWIANSLPANRGIRIVKNCTGALLGYENGKEQTYAIKIDQVVPENWLEIYLQIQSTINQHPHQLSPPADGEIKPVVSGQPFPRFNMIDVKGTLWNNLNLKGNTTLFVVWGDLPAIEFGNGVSAETDYNMIERLQQIILQSKKKLTVLAPTFTGKAELLQKYPSIKKLSSVHIVPNAETWMSDKVKIKRFPTVIIVDKTGTVTRHFEFTHGNEEYVQLEKLIHSL